jgi:hypothetical protein
MLNIPREYVQIISLVLFVAGSLFFIIDNFEVGAVLTGIAFYIVVISESILLSRVQAAMSNSLEVLRKKQEADVQDLLCFLRNAQLTASPLDSIEGAKKLCGKTGFASMVVSNTHQIITANDHMHRLLGRNTNTRELNGTPVYLINDPAVLSLLGGLAAKPEIQKRKCMTTYYVYVHKSGKKIHGQLVVHKIKNEAFFAVFYPTDDCLIKMEEIKKIASA